MRRFRGPYPKARISAQQKTVEKYAFRRVTKVILFADMVGSTHLMEFDEEDIVRRWIEYMRALELAVMPRFQGRLVKRYGDGFLAEFDRADAAVRAAFKCMSVLKRLNKARPMRNRIELRIGLHAGDVISGADMDLYGHAVNVAARIMSLAGAGEIVSSIDIRDAAIGTVNAEFEDIGDCFLKNISRPVRAFRLARPGTFAQLTPLLRPEDLLPTLAVIPFTPGPGPVDQVTPGEVLAEEFIGALSKSDALNVTSRLSTTMFRDGHASLRVIGEALAADFVLSGTYQSNGARLKLDIELARVRDDAIVWTGRLDEEAALLFQQCGVIDQVAWQIQSALVDSEIRRARSHRAPTLENYALLLAAVKLMHRPSQHDFNLAGDLLSTLMERVSVQPLITAWMAKWHVLRVQQGWTDSPLREGSLALQQTRYALDLEPTNVHALVAEGFVLTNLLHRLDEARLRYDAAIEQNPSDPLASLLRGTLFAFTGDGARATRDTERALHLTPLDPHRYFFESLAASACIAAEDYERALALAAQSLRSNRGHTSTLRVKAVAELRLGRGDAARETARELLDRQPDLTVSGWLKGAASAEFEVGREFARSLAAAGVPA